LLAAFGVGEIATLVEVGSADQHPQVRRRAFMLAENLPVEPRRAILARSLVDNDASARFQGLISDSIDSGHADGELELGNRGGVIRQIRSDANDPWLRAAMRLYFGPYSGMSLVRNLLSAGRMAKPSAGETALVREVAESVQIDRHRELVRDAFIAAQSKLVDPPQRDISLAVLTALARGLSRQRASLDAIATGDALANLRQELMQTIESNADQSVRTAAITLLAYLPETTSIVVGFTGREHDQITRLAAIPAMARQPGSKRWEELLASFAAETPPIRRAIIDGVLANADRTRLLLDAIEAGRIKPSELDPPQTKRLVESRDAAIKERAAKLFASLTPADRAQALADYQPVLQMKGDPQKGQAVFEKNCAACHRIMGVGSNVAPDISDSRTKKFDQLLADILQPNRAIDNNYLGYTVRQLDGTILTGILTAETATSITLRQQGGKDAVIARSEIDELKSSGQSLMPEGLERQIPAADMADLLSFIKNWRYLDGRTPLSPGAN